MLLRFYARPGHILSSVGLKATGQPVYRLGHDRIVGSEAEGFACKDVHSAEAFELDSESPDGRRCVKMMRRCPWDPPFWCADQATADFCGPGVTFVPVERNAEGEWVAAKRAAAKAPASKPASKDA